MSTGVLDKIGDNSTKSTESNSLLNSIGNTELERMQQLAKLVHSMQIRKSGIILVTKYYYYYKLLITINKS